MWRNLADTPRTSRPAADAGKPATPVHVRSIRLFALLAVALACAHCAHSVSPVLDPSRPLACRQVVPQSAPAVRWVVAAERDRATLSRWCETVGPVVFYPRPAEPGPPAGSDQAI